MRIVFVDVVVVVGVGAVVGRCVGVYEVELQTGRREVFVNGQRSEKKKLIEAEGRSIPRVGQYEQRHIGGLAGRQKRAERRDYPFRTAWRNRLGRLECATWRDEKYFLRGLFTRWRRDYKSCKKRGMPVDREGCGVRVCVSVCVRARYNNICGGVFGELLYLRFSVVSFCIFCITCSVLFQFS